MDQAKETRSKIIKHVYKNLDGSDYDRGVVEAIDVTTANLLNSYARLLALLNERGLLTTPEIFRVVNNFEGDIDGS